MKSIVFTAKKHRQLIMILVLSYSAELIFPAFGPILNKTVTENQAMYLSTWSMLFLILSFFVQPSKRFKVELSSLYLPILVFSLAFIVCFFSFMSIVVKWIVMALFGFTIGRIGIFWSRIFLREVSYENRGKVIGLSLFGCYGLLYIINICISIVPVIIAPFLPSFLLVSSMIFFLRYEGKEKISFNQNTSFSKLPTSFFILIFIIYITAGITYAGIYPELSQHMMLEKYYNVFPFVISVPIAGYIADRYKREYLLFIGLSLLGLSFTFHTLPDSITSYLLTQTTLQIGWAFLDAYVWIVAADIAYKTSKPYIHVFGVAFFLSGTAAGSILAYLLNDTLISNSPFYGVITHIPLFVAIALLIIIPESLIKSTKNNNNMQLPGYLTDKLSPREKEVAQLLAQNIRNKDICEKLFITENTLKTHSRNIYRKINISNKKELVKLIKNI